jgi:hypothetical protein
MVQYLNANQGFVMAILTAVYVLATLVLVILAQRQASLTQRSLDFASASEKAKYRPYVLFDIVYEEVVAYARLRNSGASPALDVRISVTPRLHWNDNDEGVGFIEKGVSLLAPARELSQPFGWTREFFEQYPSLKFNGSITYKDSEGQNYTEAIALDLGYLKGMTYIGKIDIGREIEGIKKALERFHSGGFTPLVRTIDESHYRDEEKARYEAGQRHLQELQKKKEEQKKSAGPTTSSDPAA